MSASASASRSTGMVGGSGRAVAVVAGSLSPLDVPMTTTGPAASRAIDARDLHTDNRRRFQIEPRLAREARLRGEDVRLRHGGRIAR